MSKAIRRSKKMNSDNENLFVYDDDSVAIVGPVPHDSYCDYRKNSAIHLTDTLFLEDNNTFIQNSFEGRSMTKTYKI